MDRFAYTQLNANHSFIPLRYITTILYQLTVQFSILHLFSSFISLDPLIQAQAFTLSVLHSSILNALECPLGRTGFLERVAIQCEVKDE